MIRRALRLAGLAGALAVALPAHAVSRAAGRHSGWVRRFLVMAARACGARVRVVGRPLAHDVLYAANHASWLDIVVLGSVTGAAFVSKDDVGRWPVIGSLARISGTIFISRGSRAAARSQADTVAAALATHRPVALFPEGTTSGGRTLLPFRASLFAAVGPGVAVQPVAIDYGGAMDDIEWPREESARTNVARVLDRRRRIDTTLTFLKPLDPADFPDRKALAKAAEVAVASVLGAR